MYSEMTFDLESARHHFFCKEVEIDHDYILMPRHMVRFSLTYIVLSYTIESIFYFLASEGN